jgi:hypothetical protein
MDYLREKYLKEDKEALIERILILEDVNNRLIRLVSDMNEELNFKIGILNEIIEEIEQ